MWSKLAWLAFAGACGTISRYSLCELSSKLMPMHVHLGTFTVNVLGSFLFGLIYALAQRKLAISQQMQLVILTGFMGSFTTFSAFAFDTAKLLRTDQWLLAAGNVVGQVVVGIAAMAVGFILVRAL